MACGGCGQRYNPGSKGAVVNKVHLPTGRVRGRYHIPVVTPPAPVATPNLAKAIKAEVKK